MTYSADQILRIIVSVYDGAAFYDRGGNHRPEVRADDEGGGATAPNPLSSMDDLCEVMDVRNALTTAPPWAVTILRDYALHPIGDMRSLHGPAWGDKLHLACEEIAKVLNNP